MVSREKYVSDNDPFVGSRIIELRERKGLSQKELARLAGMSQANLSRIESRRYRQEPEAPTLRRIAEVLGVKVSTILGEDSMDTIPRDPLPSCLREFPPEALRDLAGAFDNLLTIWRSGNKRFLQGVLISIGAHASSAEELEGGASEPARRRKAKR